MTKISPAALNKQKKMLIKTLFAKSDICLRREENEHIHTQEEHAVRGE